MKSGSAEFLVAWFGPGGTAPRGFSTPKGESGAAYVITDDAPQMAGLLAGTRLSGAHAIDAAALARILLPETPVDSIDARIASGGPAELERLWGQCLSKLDALPRWADDFIAFSLAGIEEDSMAALFRHWADSLGGLEGDDDERWQNSFPANPRRVERRPLPPLEDCTPLDQERVAALLGPGGPLARAVPGYEPRPGQLKMLRAVVEAFNSGRHLVVEAGTGIGKSLAYLLPAAMWARTNDVPVVVSTNTKNLQSQLVEKDLPAVLGVIAESGHDSGGPLAAAVIKGRSNYLCLRRFGQAVDGGYLEFERPEFRMFASVVAWAVNTPDGDFDSITASGAVDQRFIQNLASGSDECQGRGCRHYGRCFVQRARAKAIAANLVVANHSLVFAELEADTPVSLPPHSQIVFDEAHNLEDAATKHFTVEISIQEVHSATRRLVQTRGRSRRGILPTLLKRILEGALRVDDASAAQDAVAEAMGGVARLHDAAAAFCQSLGKLVGDSGTSLRYAFREDPATLGKIPGENPLWRETDRLADDFQSAGGSLKASLMRLAELLDSGAGEGELNLAAGDTADIKAAVERLDALLERTDFIIRGTDASQVYWVERQRGYGREYGSAFSAPVNVGTFLARHLYDRKSSVVLCSATLTVAGSFAFMASRLGFDGLPPERLSLCTAPSPFDYPAQCSLLVPEYLPAPVAQDRSFTTELADIVLRLARHYGGRTMVLFTSYEMMNQCADLVRRAASDMGLSLLVQGESGSRNLMTRVFRKNGSSLLFGTQSFWEGVDVIGEALSCVIVAKLPFASPGDPIVAARCEQIDGAGGNSFSQYSVPLAVLKLRQGFGRLIRHRLDRGTVVIADTRIVTKPYGRSFLRSLPVAAKRCPSPDEIEAGLK